MILFKKLSLFLIMLISLLISSCSPIRAPAIPTSTNVITGIPIPTNGLDLTNLTTKCAKIVDTPPKDVELRGSLVIGSTTSDSYILNLETNKKIYLEGALLGELSVSPDMQKFAYINYDTEKLVVRDAGGKELKTFDEFSGRFSLIEWLGNENIAINKANDEKPPFHDRSLLVLNTITGTSKEFYIGDFPNGNGDYKAVSWSYFGNIVPNSQLTKVIYPAEGDANPASAYGDGNPVVLWDIKSNREIRRVYFSHTLPAPKWSSDGTKLIIIAPLKFNEYVNFTDNLPYQGGDELFVINDKGEVKRLTYLTTRYKESVYLSPSWSPTEEYIAFEMQNRNEPDFGVSVLNVNTGGMSNYCIHENWSLIYWSPDGKKVAFTLGNGFEPWKAKAYVLDLEKNIAIKIADNAEVAGWVVNK